MEEQRSPDVRKTDARSSAAAGQSVAAVLSNSPRNTLVRMFARSSRRRAVPNRRDEDEGMSTEIGEFSGIRPPKARRFRPCRWTRSPQPWRLWGPHRASCSRPPRRPGVRWKPIRRASSVMSSSARYATPRLASPVSWAVAAKTGPSSRMRRPASTQSSRLSGSRRATS